MRLQLSTLLNRLASEESFHTIVEALATHELMTSVLTSLLLDDSSTVCAVALNVVTKLLPMFAIHACQQLKEMMPSLLAILAKVLCWKLRPTVMNFDNNEEPVEEALDDLGTTIHFELRPDLEWRRLKSSFETATSLPPSYRKYFTFLYYLFPCNVIRYLRGPSNYLDEREYQSPYDANWAEVLDEDLIRSKTEVWKYPSPFLFR
jgi:hypothetical protein